MTESQLAYWMGYCLLAGAYLLVLFNVNGAALRSLVQPEGRVVYFIAGVCAGSMLAIALSLLLLLPLDWLAAATHQNPSEHFLLLSRVGLVLNLVLVSVHTSRYRLEDHRPFATPAALGAGGGGQTQRSHELWASPFLFPSPVRAFIWQYGISKGRVFSRRVLGLGVGPSLDIASVVDVTWEGWLLGDVVFMSQVRDVVRWENVLFPTRLGQRADAVIKALRLEPLRTSQRQERDCPHCAEPILMLAKVCKHCGNSVDPAA